MLEQFLEHLTMSDFDSYFVIIFLLMLADLVSGITASMINKVKFTSSRFSIGLMKNLAIVISYMVFFVIVFFLSKGNSTVLVSYETVSISTFLISTIENLISAGIPVPDQIYKILNIPHVEGVESHEEFKEAQKQNQEKWTRPENTNKENS